MDTATKVAVEKYPHGKFDGVLGDSMRAACAIGYMQAEKDLALTPADIRQIVEIYDECLNLTFEEGKPAYESDGFYEEVLRRFNEQKKEKNNMTKYRAKRISDGYYLYRGYAIRRYPSEGMLGKAKYIWEAEDEHKCGFAHASTLGYCKHLIDEEFSKDR